MTELPDDVEQLKAMLLQLQQEKQAQAEEIIELKSTVQLLTEQLNLSKSKRFASQSEKHPKGTFNEAEQQNNPAPKHHKKGRKPLPDTLERETRVHTLNAPHCDCCGGAMHECGSETSEELKIIPQKVSVIRHQRTKYACRTCEKTALQNQTITAPKPASMIPRSIASPETLAAVATAKYVDALPLYRQVDMLKRADIDISRGTLANWCVQLGAKVNVLVDAMKQHLLSESLVCADETTVQVLDEPDRAATSKSYMWVYRSGEFTANPIVIYDYQPSRSSACAKGFLGHYGGYLLSDGYAVYDCLEHVTQAACLAHVRRKFTNAQKARPSKKAGKIEKALNYIGKLYQIEKEAKPLSSLERQRLRLEKSKPILDDFHQWLIKAKSTALPKSALGKAINYSLNQWPKLLTYL